MGSPQLSQRPHVPRLSPAPLLTALLAFSKSPRKYMRPQPRHVRLDFAFGLTWCCWTFGCQTPMA
jgi:hypothetical protein